MVVNFVVFSVKLPEIEQVYRLCETAGMVHLATRGTLVVYGDRFVPDRQIQLEIQLENELTCTAPGIQMVNSTSMLEVMLDYYSIQDEDSRLRAARYLQGRFFAIREIASGRLKIPTA